jgi:hypothetical protein
MEAATGVNYRAFLNRCTESCGILWIYDEDIRNDTGFSHLMQVLSGVGSNWYEDIEKL